MKRTVRSGSVASTGYWQGGEKSSEARGCERNCPTLARIELSEVWLPPPPPGHQRRHDWMMLDERRVIRVGWDPLYQKRGMFEMLIGVDFRGQFDSFI